MAKGSRGGRQNGASGTTIIPDNISQEMQDILGTKAVNHSKELVDIAENFIDSNKSQQNAYQNALQDLINPNYGKDKKYGINCQRCVTALEAQFRGYDVEALGYDKWWGVSSLLQYPSNYIKNDPNAYDPNDYIVGSINYEGFPSYVHLDSKMNRTGSADKMKRGAEAVTKQIEERMNSWGVGSRGILSVKWKDTSSAHTVNIINTKKGPVIMDGQDGHIIAGHDRLVRFFKQTTANNIALMRTDNKSLKADSNQLNKILKKKIQV